MSTPRPPPDEVYGQPEPPPPDDEFNARALAMFNATLAQAPPHIRDLLGTFSQEELWGLIDGCWPRDDELDQIQPRAP